MAAMKLLVLGAGGIGGYFGGRLAEFESLPALEATVTALMTREPWPLVARLERRPGQKDVRYAHLLSGAGAAELAETGHSAEISAGGSRVDALEASVDELRRELTELRAQFEEFKRQF